MQIESKHWFENIGSTEMDGQKMREINWNDWKNLLSYSVLYVVWAHIVFTLNGTQSVKLCKACEMVYKYILIHSVYI